MFFKDFKLKCLEKDIVFRLSEKSWLEKENFVREFKYTLFRWR